MLCCIEIICNSENSSYTEIKLRTTRFHPMTNPTALATAALVAPLGSPLITRNADNIIIASHKVDNARQSVALWVQAFKLESCPETGIAGLVDKEEYIKLTVPLTGPVKHLIEEWIKATLPGYVLADWQTWQEPVCVGDSDWF